MSLAKTAKLIEILFGLWTPVGPRNHVLDGGPDLPCTRAILRGIGMTRCKVYEPSAMSCAKTAELIEMPFGVWTQMGPRKHVVVHIGDI